MTTRSASTDGRFTAAPVNGQRNEITALTKAPPPRHATGVNYDHQSHWLRSVGGRGLSMHTRASHRAENARAVLCKNGRTDRKLLWGGRLVWAQGIIISWRVQIPPREGHGKSVMRSFAQLLWTLLYLASMPTLLPLCEYTAPPFRAFHARLLR